MATKRPFYALVFIRSFHSMESDNVPVFSEGSTDTDQSGNNPQLGSLINATESSGLLATMQEMNHGNFELSKVVKQLAYQPDSKELDNDH